MKEQVRNARVPVKAVSVRLHETTLNKIDKLAKIAQSDRTDIIRRALAIYFRLDSAVLVPIEPKIRRCIADVAKRHNIPAEFLAQTLLEKAAEKAYSEELTKFRTQFETDIRKRRLNSENLIWEGELYGT